jgi:hypothetical protein
MLLLGGKYTWERSRDGRDFFSSRRHSCMMSAMHCCTRCMRSVMVT